MSKQSFTPCSVYRRIFNSAFAYLHQQTLAIYKMLSKMNLLDGLWESEGLRPIMQVACDATLIFILHKIGNTARGKLFYTWSVWIFQIFFEISSNPMKKPFAPIIISKNQKT
jgi:hypothetical protein